MFFLIGPIIMIEAGNQISTSVHFKVLFWAICLITAKQSTHQKICPVEGDKLCKWRSLLQTTL